MSFAVGHIRLALALWPSADVSASTLVAEIVSTFNQEVKENTETMADEEDASATKIFDKNIFALCLWKVLSRFHPKAFLPAVHLGLQKMPGLSSHAFRGDWREFRENDPAHTIANFLQGNRMAGRWSLVLFHDVLPTLDFLSKLTGHTPLVTDVPAVISVNSYSGKQIFGYNQDVLGLKEELGIIGRIKAEPAFKSGRNGGVVCMFGWPEEADVELALTRLHDGGKEEGGRGLSLAFFCLAAQRPPSGLMRSRLLATHYHQEDEEGIKDSFLSSWTTKLPEESVKRLETLFEKLLAVWKTTSKVGTRKNEMKRQIQAKEMFWSSLKQVEDDELTIDIAANVLLHCFWWVLRSG